MTSFRTRESRLVLGERIGKGGEGEVYAVNGAPDLAVKLYTVDRLSDREAKIGKMIDAGLAASTSLVAFPMEIVRDEKGRFRGFLMRQISNHKPLFELYAPGARKAHFPVADYRFLVRAAANITRAIAAAHRSGCVIGDINHSGILISEQATASLIDADSFQYVVDGSKFLCRVGVPEYTPPELQNQKLDNVERTTGHDAFGLAVVIFQLLFMGRHPYSGSFDDGDLSIQEAIKQNRFVYSQLRKVGATPPPGAPSLDDFPRAIRYAFEAAFGPAGRRPTAGNWVDILAAFEKRLMRCGLDKMHLYWSESANCPWCRIEAKTGVALFIDAAPQANDSISHSVATSELERLSLVPFNVPLAQFNIAMPQPSERVRHIKKRPYTPTTSTLLLGVGLALSIGLPVAGGGYLAFVGLPFLVASRLPRFSRGSISADALANELEQQDRRIETHVAEFFQKTELTSLYALFAELEGLKAEIDFTAGQFQPLLAEVRKQSKEIALNEYLDKFFIRNAMLPGINASAVNALASFGLETAADIKSKFQFKVPGISQAQLGTLRGWVSRLESRFSYKHNDALEKREANLVKEHVDKHLSALLLEFDRSLKSIKQMNIRVAASYRKELETIRADLVERQQLVADLEFLGGRAAPVSIKLPPRPKADLKHRFIQLNIPGLARAERSASVKS